MKKIMVAYKRDLIHYCIIIYTIMVGLMIAFYW